MKIWCDKQNKKRENQDAKNNPVDGADGSDRLPERVCAGFVVGPEKFRQAGADVQAPVGHRQPRAGDVPDEKNLSDPNDPLSKENAALDRKIKSICRGC